MAPESEDAGRNSVTPDGRYFVVRGRLWRTSDPRLPTARREALVRELMVARKAMGTARRSGDEVAGDAAKKVVGCAKRGLGERGPVWWSDGTPDWNRHLAKNTPYALWAAALNVASQTPPIIAG